MNNGQMRMENSQFSILHYNMRGAVLPVFDVGDNRESEGGFANNEQKYGKA